MAAIADQGFGAPHPHILQVCDSRISSRHGTTPRRGWFRQAIVAAVCCVAAVLLPSRVGMAEPPVITSVEITSYTTGDTKSIVLPQN